jgi:acyl carrier protein
MKKKPIDIIYAAIDDLNEQLPSGRKLEKTPETVLLGAGGTIDSVSFINLIVLLEEKCQENFGVAVSLTEETPADDTFRSVATLESHIRRLVGEQGSGD